MIVACLKWVTHPGEPHDARFAGMSPADQSALEFALAQAALSGAEVTVVGLIVVDKDVGMGPVPVVLDEAVLDSKQP